MTFIRKPADPTALPLAGALFLLSAVLATPASAQDSPKLKRWAVTVNATEVFVDENARTSTWRAHLYPALTCELETRLSRPRTSGIFFSRTPPPTCFWGFHSRPK